MREKSRTCLSEPGLPYWVYNLSRHSWLHRKFKVSLAYMSSCVKRGKKDLRKDLETNTIYDDMEKSCRSISLSQWVPSKGERTENIPEIISECLYRNHRNKSQSRWLRIIIKSKFFLWFIKSILLDQNPNRQSHFSICSWVNDSWQHLCRHKKVLESPNNS